MGKTTCNSMLGKRQQYITVGHALKGITWIALLKAPKIITSWNIIGFSSITQATQLKMIFPKQRLFIQIIIEH